MKKFFTIISLLCFTLPLNAMCPIDDNATVCTLPGFRAPFTPTYNPQSNINEFADTPEARLKPIQRDDVIQEKTRGSNEKSVITTKSCITGFISFKSTSISVSFFFSINFF